MSRQLRRLHERDETIRIDGRPLRLQAHRVMAEVSTAPLLLSSSAWSVFNDLREEVSKALQQANEAKRRADRLTTAGRGGFEEAAEPRMKSRVAQPLECVGRRGDV
jgi:hypothetical protein